MRVPIMSDIAIEDLAESCAPEEALELIKAIDDAQSEWEFTIKVAKYFVGLLQASELEPDWTDWLYELKRENT